MIMGIHLLCTPSPSSQEMLSPSRIASRSDDRGDKDRGPFWPLTGVDPYAPHDAGHDVVEDRRQHACDKASDSIDDDKDNDGDHAPGGQGSFADAGVAGQSAYGRKYAYDRADNGVGGAEHFGGGHHVDAPYLQQPTPFRTPSVSQTPRVGSITAQESICIECLFTNLESRLPSAPSKGLDPGEPSCLLRGLVLYAIYEAGVPGGQHSHRSTAHPPRARHRLPVLASSTSTVLDHLRRLRCATSREGLSYSLGRIRGCKSRTRRAGIVSTGATAWCVASSAGRRDVGAWRLVVQQVRLEPGSEDHQRVGQDQRPDRRWAVVGASRTGTPVRRLLSRANGSVASRRPRLRAAQAPGMDAGLGGAGPDHARLPVLLRRLAPVVRLPHNRLQHLDDPAPQLPQRAGGGPPQKANADGG